MALLTSPVTNTPSPTATTAIGNAAVFMGGNEDDPNGVAAAAQAAQNAPPPPPPFGGFGTQAEQDTNASADTQIQQFIQSTPGLGALDAAAGGAFSSWLVGQVGTLAGQGNTDPWTTIQNIINNPAQYGDAQAQAVFDQAFPGYNARIANGYGNNGGIAGYISYASQIQSTAAGVNLLPGTVTNQMIGNAWAGDVSANEFTDRLTDGYAAAVQAAQVPGFSDFMLQNYGVTTAGLASYYLNPTNTEAVLQNQYNAGIVNTAAEQVGLGEMSQAQAEEVGHFLGTTAGGGMPNAGIGQVSQGQAANTLTGNINGTGVNAVQLTQGYNNPNGPAEQQVSENTALAAATGNVTAGAQVALAEGSRTAAAKGGGGISQNASGATGLGFAQE